jgi:hypothetical protein
MKADRRTASAALATVKAKSMAVYSRGARGSSVRLRSDELISTFRLATSFDFLIHSRP